MKNQIAQAREKLQNAEAILIGAGAGLSTAAGFLYNGERFHKYFDDFIQKYHFRNMYEGGFYPFDTLEEHWAYWSRYIYINRYLEPPKPVYRQLYRLVKDRNYFVLTTNVDHCFQKAGFARERLFYTQGDYGLFQCSTPCHFNTYDNETRIRHMVDEQRDMRIPTKLIPRCPVCHKPMSMNLRSDNTFVQDEGWERHAGYYAHFLEQYRNGDIVFLELGVGYNTPGIIKYPFWQMTEENEKATYICINQGEAMAPDEIANRSIIINANIGEVIEEMLN